MHFGIHLGNYNTGNRGTRILDLGLRAERLGFDSVWVSDHVVVPSQISSKYPYSAMARGFSVDAAELFYEALVVLSALAGMTERVRLGTSVFIAPQRNPLLAAKQLSTLDDLSGGRVDIGVGAGWLAEEFAALQAPFEQRWDALEEYLDIWHEVWSERDAAYAGKTYAFEPVRMAPKPARAGGPRITVGGHSPRAMRIAGQRAQGLHAFRLTRQQVQDALTVVREHARAAGRDAAAATVVMRCDVAPHDAVAPSTDEWRLVGPADHMVEQVRAYESAGVSEMVLTVAEGNPDPVVDATMEWFAAEVLPLVHG